MELTCPNCNTRLELVGFGEACDILGISTAWAYKLRNRGEWPKEVGTNLWLRAEMEAFALLRDEQTRPRRVAVETPGPVGEELSQALLEHVQQVRSGAEADIAIKHLGGEGTTTPRRRGRPRKQGTARTRKTT